MQTFEFPVGDHDHLAGEQDCIRRSIELIGQILSGTAQRNDSADAFLARALDSPLPMLISESVVLSASTALTVSAVLGELIEQYDPLVGPGEGSDPPSWQRVKVDGDLISVPHTLSAHFAAGTIAKGSTVVRIGIGSYLDDRLVLRAYANGGAADDAQAVVDSIMSHARGERNFLRGKVLLASFDNGLKFDVTELPKLDRTSLVLPQEVWHELDTNIASLTSRAALMRELGLGTRRGVLIAGPPGVGKSAISRIIAAELVGPFTVIIVDARTATDALREVYRETKHLGPSVIVLEDLDLYIGDRRRGNAGTTLAEFLSVLDGSEEFDDVLTLASTNDPDSLDSAATRSARFDSIIHLGHPTKRAVAQILQRLLSRVDCSSEIDCGVVAAALSSEVSGADLREVVRRAVLEYGSELTTERLRRIIADGRWKTAELTGQYL